MHVCTPPAYGPDNDFTQLKCTMVNIQVQCSDFISQTMPGCGFLGIEIKIFQPFVVWMVVAAVVITLLQKSGDIELNPGPGRFKGISA